MIETLSVFETMLDITLKTLLVVILVVTASILRNIDKTIKSREAQRDNKKRIISEIKTRLGLTKKVE